MGQLSVYSLINQKLGTELNSPRNEITHGDTPGVLSVQGVDARRGREFVIKAPSLGAGRRIPLRAGKVVELPTVAACRRVQRIRVHIIAHWVDGATVVAQVNVGRVRARDGPDGRDGESKEGFADAGSECAYALGRGIWARWCHPFAFDELTV